MTTSLNLYRNDGNTILAKLTSDKIEIFDEDLKSRFEGRGITVGRDWQTKNNSSYEIFSTDPLFHKAFLEQYFIHGLMQKGCYWKDEDGKNVQIWDNTKKDLVATISSLFTQQTNGSQNSSWTESKEHISEDRGNNEDI
jgi:hypothetical protein